MAKFAWKSRQIAAITGGGPDQDITISGIGTPVAVIVEATPVTTSGTGVDHGLMTFGISDGSTSLVGSVRHRDAQTTLDTGRFSWSAGLILLMNPTANTVDGKAIFKQWITDGVRITWTDFPAGAYVLTFTFIYGTVAQAKVVNGITAGVLNQTDPITGASFTPNAAFFYYFRLGLAAPETSSDNAFLHHGAAANNEGTIEQWTVGLSDRDARALGHGWGFGGRDDCVIQDITQNSTGAPTFGARLELANFISGGADMKTVQSALVFNYLVLYLNTGDNRCTAKLVTFDADTTGSTGTSKKLLTQSASGTWKPKAIRTVGTNI